MLTIVCVEPGRLERREMLLPEAVPGLVAVDIRAVGICGTHYHIFEGTHPFLAYPRIMGHELSGVVAGGASRPDLASGTTVVINPCLSCGHCVACRKGKPNCCATLRVLGVHIDGGMCERVLLPESNLYPAPDPGLRDAAMIEFKAIGAYAVRRRHLKSGDWVLVVGAGPIGVGTAIFARHAGGSVTLMDISEGRLATVADCFGSKEGIRAGEGALARIERLTGGDRYDVVFDATGSAREMEESFAYVASGGTLVFVGVRNADITFADPEFHRKEMTLKATRNATRADFETVMAAVRAGHVPMDALNTHSGTLADLPEAMPEWMRAPELPLKAVVTV